MLTTLKNSDGFIYALIDWEILEKDGQRLALIKYVWIHDNHRFNGAMNGLVRLMCQKPEADGVNFVGWERGEKHKQFRWFPVHRILRRI